MKERDITELLCRVLVTGEMAFINPFVIFRRAPDDEGNRSGYPVWLGWSESKYEIRRIALLPRPPVSLNQSLENYTSLGSHEVMESYYPKKYVQVYNAVPDLPTHPEAELMIGRVCRGLYLWGVHNPP